MAIRNLIKLGDNLLREVSYPVNKFDNSLVTLIEDMIETMEYEDGVGLAGVQVGVLRNVCVIKDEDRVFELINPKIIKTEGTQTFAEGCLSIPNRNGLVERPLKLTVEAYDRFGKHFTLEASDYLAVVICHELDHLNGILFIDKAKEMLN